MSVQTKPEVVVVTGASAGVGRATVRLFAQDGAKIGLLARGNDGLEATKREVEQAGGEPLILPVDVADDRQVEAAASAVENALGPIDIWINNAMTSVFSPIQQMTPEEFRRVTDVTYLGYVYGTLSALKRMVPRNRGTIVQVGSALSYRSIPLQSAYCAAKHAVKGLTESLRCELLHDKSDVHVTMVHLPALNTPQFGWSRSRMPLRPQPVPPIFQPEVAARAIHWASHHRRREVHVGWPTIKAIMGEKFVAGYIDHYLAKNGYEAQQHDGLRNPNIEDNLFKPVPGDHGAHGDFDDRSRNFSLQSWANMHPGWVAMAGLVVGGVAFALQSANHNATRQLHGGWER